jgi:hypothetical protein
MKFYPKIPVKYLLTLFILILFACQPSHRKTEVSIKGDQFYINGELTYKGRYWQGNKIEGLLLNSRMVQGIYDDANPETRKQIVYADTKKWDPERNTNEFVAAMPEWRKYGLLALTLNLQGGSPVGYGSVPCLNSAFDEKGNLKTPYIQRLEKILSKADELGMVVILGYFYFGQDQHFEDEQAVIAATDNITNWLLNKGYKNVMVEVNNECNVRYDHKILQPERVHELIQRVQSIKKNGYRLLVSTSYGGGTLPMPNVVKSADFILLHGNGMNNPAQVTELVRNTRKVEGYSSKPVLFNEDDHFNFEADTNNFVCTVREYASWGLFDYRMKDEGFEAGFQSVPVDWGINSERKKSFFKKLKEITGY